MHDISVEYRLPLFFPCYIGAAKAHMATREGGRVTYREPSEREKLQWTVKQRFQLIPPNAACPSTYTPNTVFKLT